MRTAFRRSLRAALIAGCGSAADTRAGVSAAKQSRSDDAPTWLHYFCDGSEVDPNGSVSLQGAHCYQKSHRTE